MTIVMSDLRVDGKRSDHRSIVRRSDEASSIYILYAAHARFDEMSRTKSVRSRRTFFFVESSWPGD